MKYQKQVICNSCKPLGNNPKGQHEKKTSKMKINELWYINRKEYYTK